MSELSYSYNLPPECIARRPAVPRDSARLFFYSAAADAIVLDQFLHLDKYLPQNALLILNDTKVAPARAFLVKETGGKVEALFLLNEWKNGGPIPAWLNKKAILGSKLFLPGNRNVFFTVVQQEEDVFYLEPSFDSAGIFTVLNKVGKTPVPNYIKDPGLSESELRKKYQSVFANMPASVAAPTASLHFTNRVLRKLERKGVHRAFLTLDVGRGTFAPVRKEQYSNGILHTESLSIPPETASLIRQYKNEGRPIIAVGTTVVRALESASAEILSGNYQGPIKKNTQIFIRPPFNFAITDAMITNFHLPSTSLMMLVQAFLLQKNAKQNVVALYERAIKEKFRFYSFGDTMLIQ